MKGFKKLSSLTEGETDNLIKLGVAGAIERKTVTCDLERLMEGTTAVSTSEFIE